MLVFNAPYPTGSAEPVWSGAPGWIANGAPVIDSVSGTSLAVPYPSGILYNDILIIDAIAIEASSGTPSFTTPSGWSVLSSGDLGNAFFQNAILWKRADGTETGTLTLGKSAAGDHAQAIMSSFRGCIGSGTPYEGLGAVTGSSATPTGSSVAATAGDRLVCNLIAKQSTGSPTSTPGTGWTERYDVLDGPNLQGNSLVLDTIVQATAGTVAAEATASTVSTLWRAVSFALIPRFAAPSFSVAPSITTDTGFYGTGDVATVTYTHNGASTAIQWTQDGVDISGANSASYTYVSGDVGHTVTARVTATSGPYSAAVTATGHAISTPVIATDTRVTSADTRVTSAGETRITTTRTA